MGDRGGNNLKKNSSSIPKRYFKCNWAKNAQHRKQKLQAKLLGRRTLSNSGSQESNVSDRTLEQWTPKLLKGTRRKREYIKKMKCKNSLATVFYHIFALAHFTTTASGKLLLYT